MKQHSGEEFHRSSSEDCFKYPSFFFLPTPPNTHHFSTHPSIHPSFLPLAPLRTKPNPSLSLFCSTAVFSSIT